MNVGTIKLTDCPFPVVIGTVLCRDGRAYAVKQNVFHRAEAVIAEERRLTLGLIEDYANGKAAALFLGPQFELVPVEPKN